MSVKHAASTDIGRHLGTPKSRAASSDGSGDAAQEPDAGKSTGDEGWDCRLQSKYRPTDADCGSAREGAEALEAASARRIGSVGL